MPDARRYVMPMLTVAMVTLWGPVVRGPACVYDCECVMCVCVCVCQCVFELSADEYVCTRALSHTIPH